MIAVYALRAYKNKRQWLLKSFPDKRRDALEVNDINAILIELHLSQSLILHYSLNRNVLPFHDLSRQYPPISIKHSEISLSASLDEEARTIEWQEQIPCP